MTGNHLPPPGGGGPPSVTQNSSLTSSQDSPATSPWVGGGSSPNVVRMRSFDEIIADANSSRNILEIHLKTNISEEGHKPANITHDQLGELIFDVLKINMEDCLKFNFTCARYGTREITVKSGTDIRE